MPFNPGRMSLCNKKETSCCVQEIIYSKPDIKAVKVDSPNSI